MYPLFQATIIGMLEMRRNILTFPKWDETSIAFGEPLSSHELEEIGMGVNNVWMSDYRAGIENEKNEEHILSKNQYRLSLSVIIPIIIIIIFIFNFFVFVCNNFF